MNDFSVERAGSVVRVTLTRPDRRNALDQDLVRELAAAFSDVGSARAVVLRGTGSSFCIGADVDWFSSALRRAEAVNAADVDAFEALLLAIRDCAAPVVVAAHGAVLGGGVAIVAAADIGIAARDATFAIREVRLGIVPAVAAPFMLDKIGTGAARRWFITGEQFDAQVALRIGLVHEVTEDLEGVVGRVVEAIELAGPEAARTAKRLVLERPTGGEVREWLHRRRGSTEGREGIAAVVEGRKPQW